ncbi:MAG: hypothetical protein E5Y56_32980 [Mesorhizobium sp.]|nr:hypothetical protein [Mesorhizobium sp.]TIM37633.1 MAG: hypothetical protein E5Y56_32980 [Mesorhizobium sp.]
MPIYRKAKESGVFCASEVATLGRVFDRLKREGDPVHLREALASRILANYAAGITDEDELVLASKLPLGR